jgi:protein SCO1
VPYSLVRIGLIATLTSLFLVVGCSRRAPERHYNLTGVIMRIDPSASTLTIKHEDIPGLMKGMTMEFRVKDPIVRELHLHDRITAQLVISGDDSWLEHIRIVGASQNPPADSPKAENEFHMPAPGEAVPPFHFIDERGKRLDLDSLLGKPLLITFIYSRCPLPDYCPRMNSNFAELLRLRPHTAQGKEMELLSVSFDPEHDTPAVLRLMHAQWAHGPNSKNWIFAVLPRNNLADTLQWFGLTAMPDEGIIAHSLSTTLISPEGKVIAWWHGNSWTTEDVLKALKILG